MNDKMNLKHSLKRIFVVVAIIAMFISKSTLGQDSIKPKQVIKERLTVPFGTLVKMTVEIVDGEELNDKYHESSFLFRIKSVDSTSLPKAIVIDFKDETGRFPTGEFELYKYLYGKETGEISSSESKKMKKQYVGHEFTVMAYETGEFTGTPDGYFKYQPVRQDYGFRFRHYLIIVADLTKRTE
jgi:hypothetical protein